MPFVLTDADTIVCVHTTGSAAKVLAPKLQVQNKAVLTNLKAVTGCDWVPPPSSRVACTTVTITGGRATKLKVGGVGVLLGSLTGNAVGTPGGPLSVATSPKKLTAI